MSETRLNWIADDVLHDQMAEAARLDKLIWANLEDLAYGLPGE